LLVVVIVVVVGCVLRCCCVVVVRCDCCCCCCYVVVIVVVVVDCCCYVVTLLIVVTRCVVLLFVGWLVRSRVRLPLLLHVLVLVLPFVAAFSLVTFTRCRSRGWLVVYVVARYCCVRYSVGWLQLPLRFFTPPAVGAFLPPFVPAAAVACRCQFVNAPALRLRAAPTALLTVVGGRYTRCSCCCSAVVLLLRCGDVIVVDCSPLTLLLLLIVVVRCRCDYVVIALFIIARCFTTFALRYVVHYARVCCARATLRVVAARVVRVGVDLPPAPPLVVVDYVYRCSAVGAVGDCVVLPLVQRRYPLIW